MLILNRTTSNLIEGDDNSSFTLFTSDGPITIELKERNGKQIGVAIEAPDSIRVVRNELLKRC